MLREFAIHLAAGILGALSTSLPIRAQCQSGGTPELCGQFAGPWPWYNDLCVSITCSNDDTIEFYHGALLATGPHAGKVLLIRPDLHGTPPLFGCGSAGHENDSASWLFDPGSPESLIRIDTSLVPINLNCAGNSMDRDGRVVLAGGAAGGTTPNDHVFRFDPTALVTIQYPPGPADQLCAPPYITAPTAWDEIGAMTQKRYYPTLMPLTRESIQLCTDTIGDASAVLGGPPNAVGGEGNEVWELLDPDVEVWSCPLVPEQFPGSFPSQVVYARKPDTAKANPRLDSYPKALQLSAQARRQIFIAGDTRTDTGGKPPTAPYGTPLAGNEAWTMKVPYASLQPPELGWELWTSQPMPEEHDYAPAGILFRWNPLLQRLEHNRVLVLGGQVWDGAGPGSSPLQVIAAVREFIPAGDASTGTWFNFKTPLAVPRVSANAVLLPDGTILVIGGSSSVTFPYNGPPSPVFQPELYDPGDTPTSAGSTTLLAPSNVSGWGPAVPPTQVPRIYHSMAFLLRDGRVFVVGGHIGQDSMTGTLSDSRLSGELFYPPYLFEPGGPARQPSISGLALSQTSWQELSTSTQDKTFTVSGSAYGGQIKKVTLIRVSSLTHHFNSDQRYIELSYSPSAPSGAFTITVTAPTEDIAPQGYYMLFVVEERNGKLIPSVAPFVQFK